MKPEYELGAKVLNQSLPRSLESNIPAPNAYYITTSQTNRGTHPGTIVTLKSRGTSYVYSGYALQSSVRLRDT